MWMNGKARAEADMTGRAYNRPGPRYHPGVIWGPFLLALALGLIVSAGLYFAYMWPQVEPQDDAPDEEPKQE